MFRSVRFSISTDLFISVAVTAVAFISMPILFNFLTIDEYGRWVMVGAMLPILGLFVAPFDQLLIRHASKLSHSNMDIFISVRNTVLYMKLAVSSVVCLISAALFILFGVDFPLIVNSFDIFLLSCAFLCAQLIGINSASLYALGFHVECNVVNCFPSIVQPLTSICLLASGSGVTIINEVLFITYSTTFAISSLVFLSRSVKRFGRNTWSVGATKLRLDFPLASAAKYVLALSAASYTTTFKTYLVPVLIGLKSPELAGQYSVLLKVPSLLISLGSKLSQPFLRLMIVLDQDSRLQLINGLCQVHVSLGLFLCFGFLIFFHDFTIIWLGDVVVFLDSMIIVLIGQFLFLRVLISYTGNIVLSRASVSLWPFICLADVLVITLILSTHIASLDMFVVFVAINIGYIIYIFLLDWYLSKLEGISIIGRAWDGIKLHKIEIFLSALIFVVSTHFPDQSLMLKLLVLSFLYIAIWIRRLVDIYESLGSYG